MIQGKTELGSLDFAHPIVAGGAALHARRCRSQVACLRTAQRDRQTDRQTDIVPSHSLEFCISMVINLYIARPTYHFILIYTCGLTVVIK